MAGRRWRRPTAPAPAPWLCSGCRRSWSIGCCARSGGKRACPAIAPCWRSAATAAGRCFHTPTSTFSSCCRIAVDNAARELVSDLVSQLWDVGLELGHSVRTIAECIAEGAQDVTVQTNLLEARWVSGSRVLIGALRGRHQTNARSARIPRSQAARAAAAAQPLQRHRLQPRAEHQGEPRGVARPHQHPVDHRCQRHRPQLA